MSTTATVQNAHFYRVPSDALPLVKKYQESMLKLLEDKARMEREYAEALAANLKKCSEAKAIACSTVAALLGITFGAEDIYDIDTNYLDALGLAVLQHVPAEIKPSPVAASGHAIN